MNNSFISTGVVATPYEKLETADGFLTQKTNRLVMPSVFKEEKTIAHFGNTSRPIFVPVIVGAVEQGRVGEQLAEGIAAAIARREGIQTALVGVRDLAEAPATTKSALAQADAMILIVTEYNYGYPDVLKTVLEKNLLEHARRVVGICDLSPGWFGGSRLIETLLPMMRKSGLIPIFWDENRSNGEKLFEAVRGERIDSFLNELFWMATMLRQRREAFLPN